MLAACSADSGDSPKGTVDQGSDGGSAGTTGTAGTLNFGGSIGGGPDLQVGGTAAAGLAKSVVFDPPTITLVIDDAAATMTAEYTLVATLLDNNKANVTAEALQFDRPDLAAQKNGVPIVLTATGAVAGKGTLHALYGGLEATAELDVQIAERHVDGAVPEAVIDALDGGGSAPAADPTLTSLLYPYDKTVFALGLQSPQLMWNAPNATGDSYKLHVAQAGYTYEMYAAVAAPGRLAIPQEAWDRITSSNTGDAMVVTLFRYDATTSTAYTSASVSLTIAHESLRGAIYYWTASRTTGQGNITRIHPGVGAMPETMVQGKCVGCHAVSADGSTMVVDVDDATAPATSPYRRGFGDTRAWASFNLPAGTQAMQTTMYGAGPALTPDGKYVVFGSPALSDGANPIVPPGSKNFSLALTATGAVIPTSGLDDIVFGQANVNLMMPSFSLDGTKLAAVEGGGNIIENVIPDSKRIVYMDFDASVPKFDPTLHEVVNISQFAAGNQGLGYPAFTPDNQFIAYHTGKYSTGCHPKEADETVNPCLDGSRDSGEIWVSPIGGGAPIRLSTLNDPPAIKDRDAGREPMFCPVKRGGYSWLVFTSMRDWGNELVGVGPNTNEKRRLWVAAIDGDIGTADPSHPAFYLEGQEDTPNMRGFWALSACIQTPPPDTAGEMCKANFECCSGFCVEGKCVDKTTLECSGIGESCEAAGDCCNQALVSCVDKHCKVIPPPK